MKNQENYSHEVSVALKKAKILMVSALLSFLTYCFFFVCSSTFLIYIFMFLSIKSANLFNLFCFLSLIGFVWTLTSYRIYYIYKAYYNLGKSLFLGYN